MRGKYKRSGLVALALVSSVLTSAKVCSAEDVDDPLPAGAVARLGNRRFRHEGETYSLAFSADNALLAAGASDGNVYVWQTKTGKRVRCLHVPVSLGYPPGIAFSPVGNQLAVLSCGELSFWDMATGKKLFRHGVAAHLGHSPGAVPLCFSPDGKKLYVPAGNETQTVGVLVLDAAPDGKSRYLGVTKDRIDSLAISADGKTLAVGLHDRELRGGAVRVLDVATDKLIREYPAPKSSVSAVAFSPDGKTVAWIGGRNGIILGDVKTGEQRVVPGMPATQIVFAPDGKTLVSNGPDGKVCFWDIVRKQRTRTLDGRASYWRCLVTSHDGRFLAAGGSSCQVQVWEMQSGRALEAGSVGHDEEVATVAFSPDGKRLLSGDARWQVRLWDTITKRSLRQWRTAGSTLAFSPDGKRFATANGTGPRYPAEPFESAAHVWDVAIGKELFQLPHPKDFRVRSIAFALDNNTLFTAASTTPWGRKPGESRAYCWDAGTGHLVRQICLEQEVSDGLVLAGDGRTLALGGAFGAVKPLRLWSIQAGRETLKLPPPKDWLPLAFSADGKILATRTWEDGPFQPDWENAIYLWETATGKEVLPKPLEGGRSLAFSPDGRFAAVAPDGWASWRGVKRDRSHRICLYDLTSGKEVFQFRPDGSHVASLAFSPNGILLASGLGDGTVLLWDVSAARTSIPPKGELTADEMRRRWTDLADEKARKAYQAIWTLADHPRQATSYIRERVAPINFVEASRMNKLIADLDSGRFDTRERAVAELEKLMDTAEPALRNALRQKPTLEARRRIEQVLDKLDSKPLTPERLRVLRAVTVLERIGDADARQVLTKLAAGQEDVRLTQEAKAALQRLQTR